MPSATLSAVDLHTCFKQKAELVSVIVSNVETTREALQYCAELCARKLDDFGSGQGRSTAYSGTTAGLAGLC